MGCDRPGNGMPHAPRDSIHFGQVPFYGPKSLILTEPRPTVSQTTSFRRRQSRQGIGPVPGEELAPFPSSHWVWKCGVEHDRQSEGRYLVQIADPTGIPPEFGGEMTEGWGPSPRRQARFGSVGFTLGGRNPRLGTPFARDETEHDRGRPFAFPPRAFTPPW